MLMLKPVFRTYILLGSPHGILTPTQENSAIPNRLTYGQSVHALPFQSTVNHTCSIDREMLFNPSCNQTDCPI